MTLSGLSVKRKIAMGCFIAMLVYFGAISYFKIGLDTVPKMDVPYVQAVTIYPGASPEEIETEVAKRIEDAVASLDGLKHVTSTCMEKFLRHDSGIRQRHGCGRHDPSGPGKTQYDRG